MTAELFLFWLIDSVNWNTKLVLSWLNFANPKASLTECVTSTGEPSGLGGRKEGRKLISRITAHLCFCKARTL